MKWFIKSAIAAGAAFLVLATMAPGQDVVAQEITVRYASPSAASDPTQAATLWFMEEVERRTDGRVKFEQFLGNALVRDQDILDAIGDGLVEMAKIYTVSYPGQLPLWQIGNLPFTHPSPYVAMNVIHGLRATHPEFDAEMEALNVKALGVIATGGTEIVSRKPLRSLDDLRGLQVRARGVQAMAFTAVGASPASIPWNDVYEALSRGVVDAATNYIMAVGPIRHNEVSDYFIKVGLGQAIQAEIVNLDFWNALPDDIRQIMEETMRDSEARFYETINEIAVSETDRLGKASSPDKLEFITFPVEERQRWIDESPDFFAEWARENAAHGDTEAMVKTFRELEAEFAKKGDELGYTSMW
jgi:TRAP-type transport system periplasmic protein